MTGSWRIPAELRSERASGAHAHSVQIPLIQVSSLCGHECTGIWQPTAKNAWHTKRAAASEICSLSTFVTMPHPVQSPVWCDGRSQSLSRVQLVSAACCASLAIALQFTSPLPPARALMPALPLLAPPSLPVEPLDSPLLAPTEFAPAVPTAVTEPPQPTASVSIAAGKLARIQPVARETIALV